MVENFEFYTDELTTEEEVLIPLLISGFKTHNESDPVKAPEIVKKLNQYLTNNNLALRITEPKLRKCVNYIRTNGLLPLIATSKGYFTSTNKDIIESQIRSLNERSRSIQRCADGLSNYLNPRHKEYVLPNRT